MSTLMELRRQAYERLHETVIVGPNSPEQIEFMIRGMNDAQKRWVVKW